DLRGGNGCGGALLFLSITLDPLFELGRISGVQIVRGGGHGGPFKDAFLRSKKQRQARVAKQALTDFISLRRPIPKRRSARRLRPGSPAARGAADETRSSHIAAAPSQ